MGKSLPRTSLTLKCPFAYGVPAVHEKLEKLKMKRSMSGLKVTETGFTGAFDDSLDVGHVFIVEENLDAFGRIACQAC